MVSDHRPESPDHPDYLDYPAGLTTLTIHSLYSPWNPEMKKPNLMNKFIFQIERKNMLFLGVNFWIQNPVHRKEMKNIRYGKRLSKFLRWVAEAFRFWCEANLCLYLCRGFHFLLCTDFGCRIQGPLPILCRSCPDLQILEIGGGGMRMSFGKIFLYGRKKGVKIENKWIGFLFKS